MHDYRSIRTIQPSSIVVDRSAGHCQAPAVVTCADGSAERSSTFDQFAQSSRRQLSLTAPPVIVRHGLSSLTQSDPRLAIDSRCEADFDLASGQLANADVVGFPLANFADPAVDAVGVLDAAELERQQHAFDGALAMRDNVLDGGQRLVRPHI
jgi:hypothetical protein